MKTVINPIRAKLTLNGSINPRPRPMVRGENTPTVRLSKLNAILYRRQLVKQGSK